MKIPTRWTRLCAVAVLVAPLVLGGSFSESMISQLKLTKYTEPEFPVGARMEGIPDGLVTLAIGRDEAGVPGDILVIDATDRRFAEAAVTAVRTWRFAPVAAGAERAAELVRIGFRLKGVVYISAHNQNKAGLLGDFVAQKLREPVRIPELPSLAVAPKIINQPMPAYPAALTAQAIEGSAKVHFYIDVEGRVRLPHVIEATRPEFAAAALLAVAQWRYDPPTKEARKIVAAENWSFKFAANN